ncbi:hypothetical protein ACUIJQ_10640 [Levilactobacillus hammesii]|uniref:Uncharacterized protein n=1 Tax=Levilactobacillus hammesii DSM 16381 TaxID=1423753 RepID=A0A0R1UKP5_9LACO|nr:hypothetical protein [Levilactobacillus hammesii]KRL93817.1 hypothetical protein FD28_GL001006 [Levilactobacillus hammesii DSM 16381]
MTEVLTVIREFDVFGNSGQTPYGIDTPKINAQFVGISPAMAFDTNNQPKLARQNERQLRTIEDNLRHDFHDKMAALTGNDLGQNLQAIQDLVTTFKARLEQDLLVKDQLELENLTLSGEWLTYWQDDAPLAKAKAQQQENLPQDF